jgi:hypothetical protein
MNVRGEKMKKMKDKNGVLVVAGVLIGTGIGMAYNQVAVGSVIGLGVGFLAMWIASMKK